MTPSTHTLALVALPFALALLLWPLLARAAGDGAGQKSPAPAASGLAPGQSLAGPFTCENLTIYLIRGPDTLKGDYLTLEEAMAAKKVVVHETGNVNELSIENVGDQPVFIQSGDIVKGGKQDRCLGTDITLVPRSGKVPIAAFCVESGRWRQRGGESAAQFGSSRYFASGSRMKLAANANYSGSGQAKVWEQVQQNQQKLSETVGGAVTSDASPSSFQLTLENKKVQEAVERYVQKLTDAPAGEKDIVGYAAAINGKVSCADSYGSAALFRKLWPKLLRSAATEAAAEAKSADGKAAAVAEVDKSAIEAALNEAAAGKRTQKDVGDAVRVITSESDRNVMFESRARAGQPAAAGETGYLHRSVIRKD